MQTVVLGFGYKARHGKDTAVKAIIEARGGQYDIRAFPFAKALKEEYTQAAQEAGGVEQLIKAMRHTHNLPDWVQYETDVDMTDPYCPLGKQRTLLQWWGTEYRRKQDPFYWVRKTSEDIDREKPQIALVSDVRFLNEVFWVKSRDGYTIKVSRHGFADTTPTHVSERELDGYAFDITIDVLDGAIDQLKKDAVTAFDMVIDWITPPVYTNEDFTEQALTAAQ